MKKMIALGIFYSMYFLQVFSSDNNGPFAFCAAFALAAVGRHYYDKMVQEYVNAQVDQAFNIESIDASKILQMYRDVQGLQLSTESLDVDMRKSPLVKKVEGISCVRRDSIHLTLDSPTSVASLKSQASKKLKIKTKVPFMTNEQSCRNSSEISQIFDCYEKKENSQEFHNCFSCDEDYVFVSRSNKS